MRLFIAEKPSVAKALAAELGVTRKVEGYIECGEDKITWCFGHMLELAEPDDYTSDEAPCNPKTQKKLWRTEDLPIIPSKWIIKPKKDAEKQLNIIGQLLKEASLIINAGDCDREGQLLIDEVLDYFNSQKQVLRFWVSAHDSVSLKRGLTSLKDNSQYEGLKAAAMGRSRADWLIGMNLSRAYTLSAKRFGGHALVTVGRVQTPTLALVVARDREIESFKPKAYHTLKAAFQLGSQAFVATFAPTENQEGLDSEGRLVDTAIANQLILSVSGKSGFISHYAIEPKKKNHPRAYSLSDLTLKASNQFGFTATQVLDACQSLYETHKLTSYPRTDCAFLPESQHADAPQILEAIKRTYPKFSSLIEGCESTIKSTTWDDSKVTAHFGIIPTMHQGNIDSLNEIERSIYDLIVRAYLAQFYPLHEYLSTTVQVEVEGLGFKTSGKTITQMGWQEVYIQEDDESENADSENQALPLMSLNDSVLCLKATRLDAKTKPPSRFTEGTLQRSMENIHKTIGDKAHKQLLREGDGLGTSATRASIISELKRREYLETKGRYLISTALGRSVIDALPEMVKSPVLTALYERVLKEMEKDATLLNGFIDTQIKFVMEHVEKANQGTIRLAGAKPAPTVSTQYTCLHCGKGLCRRPGKKGFWWSCSGYPQCSMTYPDLKGKPNLSINLNQGKSQ